MLQILSWYPRAVLYQGFANSHVCDNIVKLAKRHLVPSGLALRKGETSESTKNIRTSSGTFLSSSEDSSGALAWVERRIAEVVHLPVVHGEAFNVLRYELGQKYDAHYDTFNPAEYGPQKSQRIATVLLYLSDVEEGGETMFPYEDFNIQPKYNFQDCVGLLVKPRKGDALLFYSVWPNKTLDMSALHGGCPVTKGEKWVATKWIRDEARDFQLN
ncbi:hypothetical protein CBR_g39762 [Chara braunii]|uniref:procollagen-proline 4-dioxygenase n=1 Tax=Chara braunii TaxID=69332 RepID=A0A388LS95_CHABU|nr:hypothetical protein CBR_g39762 [Chara braunii]|eukprot:GBG85197.1 hypothetical protein CBR_g39762 [Chara braunii]